MPEKTENLEHYFAAAPKSKLQYGLIRTCLRGRSFEFVTASGVFSKHRVDLGTRLLVESMLLPAKGCLLDMGCGYGVVGIAAAAFNPHLRVVMVDVNIRAVRLARLNLEKNYVRNVEVRRGLFYRPLEDLAFDCILSNPPVSAGLETVKKIITEAPGHMSQKGVFEMVVKSKVGGKRFQAFFEQAFGNVEILARESGYRVLISRMS